MKKYNNPYGANTQREEESKPAHNKSPKKKGPTVTQLGDLQGITNKAKAEEDQRNVGEGDAQLPPTKK